MMKLFRSKLFTVTAACVLLAAAVTHAQVVLDASKLLARTDVLITPRTGSFVEGSTFQVPILVDTKGRSINGIEVRINYDRNRLAIVNPMAGTSIIGVWVEPPKYDNTRGSASYVGVIPGGITTDAGLVGTITFKAIATGKAVVSVTTDTRILLNDGLGTRSEVSLGRAEYTLLTKAPEGVDVYSETHPMQEVWYNNDYAVLSWEKDPGVNGFSYILDDKPSTIPDNTSETTDTGATFDKLKNGVWYFHIKAKKGEAWGGTGHYAIHVDTAPPAEFTPEANYLVGAVVSIEKTLISFFTTDNLSGVDHYEVGIIDKSQSSTESPAFVEAQSPFQVPISGGEKLKVIVRAIDKAGNVRDASIDVAVPFVLTQFIKDYLVYILAGIILLGLTMLIVHYLLGHHIIRYLRRGFKIARQEEEHEHDNTSDGGNTYNLR